jgi:type II secretory pathway pseudopilin PulG
MTIKVLIGSGMLSGPGGPGRIAPRQAFTIVEVLIGVAVVGTLFVTLYAGFSSGFMVIQAARENLRATQILQEKMETIRLYSWDQINTPGFMPEKFQAPFYAVEGHGDPETPGLTYYGTVEIAPTPLTESYSTNLRRVKITLKWQSGQIERTREVETFVSRYGLQNYVY